MRDAAVDPELYGRILAAWSIEGFHGPLLPRHQHFFDTFGKFAKNDAWVDGGAAGVASTDFRDSPKGRTRNP